MFRSRRGPVPSEAALRALRRLAYISSGTACGAAALVAEERRRQISVASKIVDNSRRLKQHPRYHHTQVHTPAQAPAPAPAPALAQARQAPPADDVDAFRSSVLPSEVDKAYAKFSQHETSGPPPHRAEDAVPPATASRHTARAAPTPALTSAAQQHLDTVTRLAAASPDNATLAQSILRLGSGPCAVDQLQYLCRRIHVLLAAADPRDVESIYLPLFAHVDHHDAAVQECKALVLQHLAAHGRLLSSMSLLASIRTHQGRSEAFVQLERCCQRLIALGYPSTALDLLVASSAWPQASSPALSALSPRLFDALLERHASADCCRLLEWMHSRDLPCGSHLSDLFRSCASRHDHATLLSLYRTHREHHPIPNDVFPALCAAASTSDPSLCASAFVQHIHLDDHDSVLPVCEPAWPAILESLWDRSRNFKLIDGTVKKMHRIVGTRQLTLDVHNAMIRICIDAGQIERAKGHLRTVQRSDRISPDIVTFGHFVRGAAKASDWPAMDQLMVMLTRSGDQAAAPAERALLFAPVLIEYAKAHTPEETRDFAFRAFDSYGVEPNQDISDIVVAAFSKAHRLDLVNPWLNHMKSHGLDARPSPRIAFRLIRQFYYDARPPHTVLMWLCRRLVKNVPGHLSQSLVALLREAVAHDLRTYNSGLKHMALQAKYRLQLLTNVGSTLPDPKYAFQFRQTELRKQLADLENDDASSYVHLTRPAASRQDMTFGTKHHGHRQATEHARSEMKREVEMLISISVSHPSRAVRLYRESLSESGLPRSSYALDMAVHAQVKASNEGTKAADELIHAARDAGSDTTAALLPVLLRHVQQSRPNSRTHIDNLYRTVLSFYQKMLTNNVTIKHHLATAAAQVLIEQQKSEDAIRLLAGILHSKWAEQVPLDLPAMTTFLQAYINLRHGEGIDWVVNQVLSENHRVDRPFLLVLDNAHRYYRREVHRANDPTDPAVEKSRALAKATRDWFLACQTRQAEQHTKTSRFGNRLVKLLINLAKRPRGIDASLDPGQVDSSISSRGLRDKDGRRFKYRLTASRGERAWRRRDSYMRRQRRKTPLQPVT